MVKHVLEHVKTRKNVLERVKHILKRVKQHVFEKTSTKNAQNKTNVGIKKM